MLDFPVSAAARVRPTGAAAYTGGRGRRPIAPLRSAARALHTRLTFFLELLALAGLITLNAFFVAAEYGLVTSRPTRIRELERDGNRRARAVVRITSDPPRFISAMQLGVTVTSLAIGADRKSTRLNSSHVSESRMPSSA